MSIHDGHRQRLKTRFLEEGLDGFTQIQALELLLFYCIPRKDTNPISRLRCRNTAVLWLMPGTLHSSSTGASSTCEKEPKRSSSAWAMGLVSLRGMQ